MSSEQKKMCLLIIINVCFWTPYNKKGEKGLFCLLVMSPFILHPSCLHPSLLHPRKIYLFLSPRTGTQIIHLFAAPSISPLHEFIFRLESLL